MKGFYAEPLFSKELVFLLLTFENGLCKGLKGALYSTRFS